MKKYILVFLFGWIAITLSGQDCSDLFFSEYIEGTGNNKGLEIYNPTDKIINLQSYYVARYSNGARTYEQGGITRLQGFIKSYSTHVLVNGQTVTTETSPACDPAMQALAQQLDHDYPAPTYMNGNDAIALFKDLVGNGDVNDFIVLDLFGKIQDGMTSDDEGWASFTDAWVYRNIYENNEIVGRDSAYIQNYIVPPDYYWIPWSSNHSLVRKASVKEGVKSNPAGPFVITEQWDTIPGGANQWDSLNAHFCDCKQATAIDLARVRDLIHIYPNPFSQNFYVESTSPFKELILMDASARVIFRQRYERMTMEKMVQVPETDPGIYFLKVHLQDGIITKKIVIN